MSESSPELAEILTDRYRIIRQIGQGGMATVYLAEDIKLEREVALKVLRPELGAVLGTERFLAEVKITARLDHPHILTLIDSGTAGGLLYYVLPFVRGESLRDLLDREQQLSIEQALAITKHIASALDYAHRKGIVHRDIKPENILLQEGEAMLADFGIALAVQESGGGRLTETGLSLGTPYYMSPEQATGERSLDARSDLYSLASVTYEMLVGEPPMTGKTTQAVIAKLLTETAMHVRTVRNTVPEHVDAAIAKALSKVPADRFHTVADFSRAIEAGSPTAHTTSAMPAAVAPPPRSRKLLVGAAVVALLVVALGAYAMRGRFATADTSAALRDRSQLTFSGKVSMPTLSADGKQLAYFTRECKEAECRYSVDVQDVGSTNTRRIAEGATSAYGLEWSPDRRNLLAIATFNSKYGRYVVSALGGAPRYIGIGSATFFANGDSVLLGSIGASDSTFTVKIAGLDGTVRDSIKIPGPGSGLASLVSIPGTSRFVSLVVQQGHGLWQVHERDGTVRDKLLNSCTCGAAASHDALWMTRAGPTAAEAVVRVALDPASGKFAAHQDTIYSGRFSNLSVTADGLQMAVDDGSYTFSVVAASVAELLSGKAFDAAPVLQASNAVNASASPDGARLLLRRSVPSASGGDELRFSIRSFEGGAETPLNLVGNVKAATWIDSVTVGVHSLTPTGSRFTRTDVRTNATSMQVDEKDSTIVGYTALPDGWAWIPGKSDRVIIERGGKRSEILKPSWFDTFYQVDATDDGSKLAIAGWNAATNDTVGVVVFPTGGGQSETWVRAFGEQGVVGWMSDGSLAFALWMTSDAVTLQQYTAPVQSKSLGTVAHVARTISLSGDLKRGTVMWRDYRGDSWMYRVVKP